MNIETPQQIALVRRLHQLQTFVLTTDDRKAIEGFAREAVSLAVPVPPCINDRLKNRQYRNQSKDAHLKLLLGEIENVINEDYLDLETVHFQISATIGMLMLDFVDGGVSRGLEIRDGA